MRLIVELVLGDAAARLLLVQLLFQNSRRDARVDEARSPRDTRWATIAELYRQLERLTDNPVVRLQRAVAEGEAAREFAEAEATCGNAVQRAHLAQRRAELGG